MKIFLGSYLENSYLCTVIKKTGNMTRQEILDALMRCASLEINENGDAEHIGSIARSWTFYLNHIKSEIKSWDYYSSYQAYYDRCKAELESLPWNVVDNPRNPKDDEYPSEDGTYITMLDCNEHEVLTNDFRNGFWTLYHKTHISFQRNNKEKT